MRSRPIRPKSPSNPGRGIREIEWRGEKLPEGTVNLFGKKRRFSQFVTACRKVNGKTVHSGPFDDAAVRVTGTIVEVSDSGWKVEDKAGRVAITFSEMPVPEKLREGHEVTVYGIARGSEGSDSRDIDAWHVALEPPGVRYEVALRQPDIVVGGTDQIFTVDCVVRNTGRQTLKNLTLAVRLAQTASPNDQIETFTIPELKPGQTLPFQIDFEFFNFQYIGKTSVPQIVGSDIVHYEL